MDHVADRKTNRALLTACDFAEYCQGILREIPLSADQGTIIAARYGQARWNMAVILLAILAAGRQLGGRELARFLPRHPGMIVDLSKVAAWRVIRGQHR